MPVGSREGLGLPRTRKFACPTDSGWVAGRMDGLWGLGGVWARKLSAGPAKCTPMGCKLTLPRAAFFPLDPKPAGADLQELCEALGMETKCWCQVEKADGSSRPSRPGSSRGWGSGGQHRCLGERGPDIFF